MDNVEARLVGIESTLGKLTALVEKFARIEEKQVNSKESMERFESHVEHIYRKLESVEKCITNIKVAQSKTLWLERVVWGAALAGITFIANGHHL